MGDIEGSSNAAHGALQDIEAMEPKLNGVETGIETSKRAVTLIAT